MTGPAAWFEESASAARKLVPNPAYRGIAAKLATCDRHALDYLRQAPVLVPAACFGRRDHGGEAMNYIAGQFGAKCNRKLKLREMMAEYRVAYQFRALLGSVLCPSRCMAIFAVSQSRDIHPSALAQSVPDTYQAQVRWLRAVTRWGEHMCRRQRSFSHGLSWLATSCTPHIRDGHVEVSDVADLYREDPACFNPKWTFDQAKAAADRWHRMMAKQDSEEGFFKRYGLGFSEPIDYAPFPGEAEALGYRFVALDSGEELFAEGVAMHHCVGSYSGDVIMGYSRIYSVRSGERRLATLELITRINGFDAGQLKGPCNSAPPKSVVAAANLFMADLSKALKDARRGAA